MTLQKKIVCSTVVLSCAVLASCGKGPAPSTQKAMPGAALAARVMEGYPAPMVARLAAQQEERKKAMARPGNRPFFLLRSSKRWAPGQVLRVAFSGGTPALHRQIESAAAQWTMFANIGLDFGYDAANGTYRTWNPSDTQAAAEIRIGFNAVGYWSCVGNDSLGSCAQANEASMNFQGFDRSLPPDSEGVVRHEFGHALGFEHEHQAPDGNCDAHFRWDDDPGYVKTPPGGPFGIDAQNRRPGIYTYLSGPPNSWSREMIDFNLRQFKDTPDLTGVFDKHSIMMYHFDDWMLIGSTQDPCYTDENLLLSDLDRQGLLKAYPRDPKQITSTLTELRTTLQSVISASELSARSKDSARALLKTVK
jgi:hypothetical protein